MTFLTHQKILVIPLRFGEGRHLAAFRPLGKGSELRVTPPYDSDTIDINNLMKAKCGYFNLHGLAETA